METSVIMILAVIAMLILSIVMIVKFFQMASDIREMKELYVDGLKKIEDGRLNGEESAYRYYKLPLEETNKEDREADKKQFVEDTNKKRESSAD